MDKQMVNVAGWVLLVLTLVSSVISGIWVDLIFCQANPNGEKCATVYNNISWIIAGIVIASIIIVSTGFWVG